MVLLARCGSVIVTLGALAVGCASTPNFPATPRDAGTACNDALPCPSGQSCLQGTCYAACDMTHACSPRETCQHGVCVAGTNDAGPTPHDVGTDGGPCPMLMCASPTICRGDVAACVACDQTHATCGGASPVCDVGRGSCTTFSATICAACNTNADCPPTMTCIERMAPDAIERVCLPACSSGGTCATPGFVCTASTCTPFVTSCTAHLAAVANRACTADADCPQLGATVDNGLVTGMCFEATAGAGMTCHAACGTTADCASGTCMASPAGGAIQFCQ